MKSKETYEKNEIVVSRPVWSDAIKGKRAEVWFRRSVSAYDLASRLSGEVTETEYAAAKKLLDSVQRYALADTREWERENSSERYCNSLTHKQRESALNRRRERLQNALYHYRCKLVNYGLYPTIIDTKTRESLNFLHYFD